MLQNEKYKGDALLQKSFTIDYLTKQKKKNEGELPQYYVENNHKAIIDKATFDLVQLELKKPYKRIRVSFCGKVICGCCGNTYGRHVWHSNSKYRRYIYRCNKKYRGEKKCKTPAVSAEQIQNWSIEAINKVITNKDEIINNMKLLIKMLENTDDLTKEIKNLELEMADIQEQAEKMVQQNTKVIQNQETYQKEYDKLVAKYEELQSQLFKKQSTLQRGRKQSMDVKLFVELLAKQEHMVTVFDEKLFNTLIEKIVIHQKDKIEVYFKNSQAIEI